MELVSLDKLPKRLGKFGKNLRFAGVLTLTWTAQDGQKEVRKDLNREFELRNTFTEKGIRIKPATKQRLESEVFTKDWFIAQHDPGDKRVKPRSTPLIIETEIRNILGMSKRAQFTGEKRKFKGARLYNTLQQRTRKPPVIGKTGNRPFIRRTKSGTAGIFVRRTNTRLPIALLYKIQKKPVKIDKTKFFRRAVERAYNQKLIPNYNKALRRAFTT